MSFGEPGRGGKPWSLGADASRDIIKQALEYGVNFLDTANGYSAESREEIVGQAVKDFTRREEVVLSTKVWMRMRPGPNGAGLSRKAISAELDASLKRLGTGYIDLYRIHRWDYDTPIEETFEALHEAVKSGKVRYIGASSMCAWQFAKALYLADLNGWTRFVSMQDHYNLIHREAEREILPLCADQGIGVIPWSPLARGRLTRARDTAAARAETDAGGKILHRDEDQAVAERVHEVAGKRGLPPAQVALAWVMRNPAVTSPVVGVTKPAQLADAVAAVDVELDEDEAAYLQEFFYKSRPVAGSR
ncbi:oxidoreductase [Streptomyces minutiscleroticus]|uniref:Oxidoreductase n=2 Tax=Streptomyces minutiscleroticus TaxID=68238 RepID=A0A918P285_9ACTN|nr:oxidoreductase [Streptomyces minutiscleroticus]